MRISDLSTFDSKPILLSQFAELLNSNNITMQGNQVNVPSGLVLLDDKGKIPEDADIQRIFYIDGEFPTENLVKNALYVSSSGEARATGENAEYINISLQVVSDFSAVSDDTVATSKAIKEYVDSAVAEASTGTSGVLSSYATKEYVDSAVASASGEQHIFYVDEFPATDVAVANSLYVKKGTKEAQIFDGAAYASISLETVEDFTTVSNDTLATTQAISSFVDTKIAGIDIPDPDLSAYQPVSSMTDYAKKTDIPKNITTQGNTFNSGNHLVKLSNGKIPSGLYDRDIQHIFKVNEFPTSGLVENSIYILESGEAKAYFAGGWVEISQEVETTIDTSATDDTIPTSKAVKDYVDANKGETIDLTNYTKESISITASGMTGDLIKLTSSETGASITFDDTGYVRILGDVQTYINVGNGVNLTSNAPSADLLRLNDKGLNQAGGLVQLGSDGKLPAVDGSLLTNLPSSAVDLTNYVSTGAINLTTVKESAITLKADAQVEGYEITFSIGSGVGPTSDLGAYLKLGSGGHFSIVDGYSFRVGSTDGQFNTISFNSNSLLFNGNEYNTANGLVVVGDDGKIPSSLYNGGLTSISVGSGLSGNGTSSSPLVVDLSNYHQSTAISLTSPEFKIGGSSIIIGTGTGNNIYLNYDDGVPDSNIYVNNHALNTAGGLVLLGSDGKIPSSLYDAGSQSIFQVDSFPSSGTNNSLYVDKATSEVKGYFDGAWQNISFECVDVISGSASTETVPSTKAVKDYVDALPRGPEMKTIAVTKDIVFKKDISVYKIEVANATTFTFDFSQLDENNCYTFELWVSMSTPVTLTFPSDVAWLNNEVPDMSEASTYCIVVRKLPAAMATSTITSPKALLNLAYQYPLVLG
ncbi:MAG: hypothetical protein J6J11_09145 [Treponema sp.]|nr:hypothetical protein [Clostridia bacterium]MBP3608464.1 hypothetical protein [Treponema sp.]